MSDIIIPFGGNPSQSAQVKFIDNGDGSHSMSVSVAGGSLGGGSATDKEFVVTTYSVKTAATGISVGDVVTCTQVYDVSGTTPTLATTIWYNQSTAAVLASAPAAANLTTLAAGGATEATLASGLGAPADAAAGSDGATASLISLIKRLLAKFPALVGGRMPVDNSGAIQLGSGAVTPTTQRVTLASDGPEVTNSTASRNSLASIDGKLPASLGAKTSATSLSVVPASDSAYSLTPTSVSRQAAIARPANVTAYTAGDVIGSVLQFSTITVNGGYIMIAGVDVRYDVATLPAGMGNLRLHLYTSTPPSAFADNAAWDLPGTDRAAYAGFIDVGTLTDLGSTLYASVENVNVLRKLDAGNSALFGYLQTTNGFTPAANSETLMVTVRGLAGL